MTPEQQKAWLALGLGPVYLSRDTLIPPPGQIEQQVGAERAAGEPGKRADAVATGPNPAQISALNWTDLRAEISTCQRCALAAGRRHAVFGIGVETPTWLIVGEAPGEQEDRSGEPFVGEAGHLLDSMLASVGAARTKNAFVLNVLKCRPPGNRDPQLEEVTSCRPFLMRQIELLEPALILTVGRFAAQTLLGVQDKIGALRGKVHTVSVGAREVPLVASYHPAYFLRRPEEKLKGWQDLCLAQSALASTAE